MSETMEQDKNPVVDNSGPDPGLAKFRMWVLGPFETIQGQQEYQERSGEWLIEEQERIVDLQVGADVVSEFAGQIGVGHLDKNTFLTALRCYAIRKGLVPDYVNKRFVHDETQGTGQGNAGTEITRPPSPAVGGLATHEVAELVQLLAATKLENERLRAAAIPRLTKQELERMLAETLPYQWMQTLAVGLITYSKKDPQWDAHELSTTIWKVVHEELRNKRQGRNSHMPIPQQVQGAGNPGTHTAPGAPLGRAINTPGGQQIMGTPVGGGQCFVCGQIGHWARNCPQAALTGTLNHPHVQAKISQVGDQTVMTSNKGWTFDLNGPPPANCRRCGQLHWEMFPCGAQGRVSLLPQPATPVGQAGVAGGQREGSDDAVLRMVQDLLQSRALDPGQQQ